MADVFTKEKRSEIMSRIKSKNTKLETDFLKHLSARLYRQGIRYRKHYKKIKGSPDVAFVSSRIAVFLDGEFWHGRGFKALSPRLPKTYWRGKIRENILRDKKTNAALRRAGWTVLRFWESDIKKRPEKAVAKIEAAISAGAARSKRGEHEERKELQSGY